MKKSQLKKIIREVLSEAYIARMPDQKTYITRMSDDDLAKLESEIIKDHPLPDAKKKELAHTIYYKMSQSAAEKQWPHIPYAKLSYWVREKLGIPHVMSAQKYYSLHHQDD